MHSYDHSSLCVNWWQVGWIVANNVIDRVLGIESISMARLNGWENEIIHSINTNQSLSKEATKFIESPSYGDGGMAAAIRIVSIKQG